MAELQPIVSPEELDRKMGWPAGQTRSLVNRKLIPFHFVPNGQIFVVESEVRKRLAELPLPLTANELTVP